MDRSARWSSRWMVAAALALAGCGGPASFHGTVSGRTLDVKDSLFIALRSTGGQITSLMLIMADRPNLCETMKAGSTYSNMRHFDLLLLEQTSAGQIVVPTPGDFILTDNPSPTEPKFAAASLRQNDATCDTPGSVIAVGGMVTLQQYKAEAGGTMTGHFDATFEAQAGRATGDFNVPFCDISFSPSNCL